MNGLDLFSGIGGLTKALEGYVTPVAYCENDRYAQAVLLSRMSRGDLPIKPIWDDVTTLRGDMLPAVDILYGGFPCQDISVIGRGAGLGGSRSGLFFEIIRLIETIWPAFVFLENVSAIRTRGADTVVKEFSRLRYDCRWGVLSARDVGANHRRERWWLLAHRFQSRLEGHPRNGAPTSGRKESNGSVSSGGLRKDVADANSEYGERGRKSHIPDGKGGTTRNQSEGSRGWWESEPDVGRVANGVSFRVDRLRALGNSVVPAQAREAFERLMGLKC